MEAAMKKDGKFVGLVLEYMKEKLVGGYDPMFTLEEFSCLLRDQFQLEIDSKEVNELFQYFFQFMKNPWSRVYYSPCRTEYHPHMIQGENKIYAAELFDDADSDMIRRIYQDNPSFLGLDWDSVLEKIANYLKRFPQRKMITTPYDDSSLTLGKTIASTLLSHLLSDEREDFLDSWQSFQDALSTRFASFISEYPTFVIRNICPRYRENYFEYSNYLLLIRGYEDLMDRFNEILIHISLEGNLLHIRVGDFISNYIIEDSKGIKVKQKKESDG